MMAKPFVISIPHRLGKDEAINRLKLGLDRAAHQYGDVLNVDEAIWSGDRLNVRVRAFKQTVSGAVDVRDDVIRIEVVLPWLLSGLASMIQDTIEKRATLLLEKKK